MNTLLKPIRGLGGKPKPGHQNGRPKPHVTEESVAEEDSGSDISAEDWRSVERLKYNWENTPHNRASSAKSYIFWVDRNTKYSRHADCSTPDNEVGTCHFVQHCPIPDVIQNFDVFLEYVCYIRNRYVGICCPNSYLGIDNRPKKPRRRTTKRPRPPPIRATTPPPIDINDGSNYNGGLIIYSNECSKIIKYLIKCAEYRIMSK